MHCCCLLPYRRRMPPERARRPLPPRPEPLTVTSSVLLVYRPPAAVWARRAVIDDARKRGATLTREHGCAALRRQPLSGKLVHRYVPDTVLGAGCDRRPSPRYTRRTSTPDDAMASMTSSGASASVTRVSIADRLQMRAKLTLPSLVESATTTTLRARAAIRALTSASPSCCAVIPPSGSTPSAPRKAMSSLSRLRVCRASGPVSS